MVQAGINGKYDISFLDASGNEIGLILSRDKNNIPKYLETNDPGLSSQYFTGQAGYANLEPEKEIQIGQDDWRSGFGLEYADKNDTKRYYTGKNIDTRLRGHVKPGPKITDTTLPTLYTIVDGAMELWDDANNLTNWTETVVSGLPTLTRNNTNQHGGTYCAFISAPDHVAGSNMTLHQDLDGWAIAFSGKVVTVKAWVKAAAGGGASTTCNIGINDGIGTTTAACTIDSAYHQITVSRTLDASAFKIRIIFTGAAASGSNLNMYIDDVTINAYGAHGSCFAEFNDDLYFASSNILLKLGYTTGVVTYVAGFPDTITDLEAFTDDKLYIALGASSFYWYMSTAEACTVTNSYAYLFKAIGNTMYKALLPRSIYTATAPTADANWSSATLVGSSAENITSIQNDAGTPYIGKEDYPYYINSTGTVLPLMQDLISEKSATSGKNAYIWQGKYYYPCGLHGLYEYDNRTVTNISPINYQTNWIDSYGQVKALTSDADWLYAVVDNNTVVDVLAGRWETIDGSTSWVWHTLTEITLAGCSDAHAFTYNSGVPTIYVGSTSSADALKQVTFTWYESGGELVTPYYHCEFKGDLKAFYKITLSMSGTTSSKYWKAYYQKLGDSAWTEINSTVKFKTSPTTTAYLPVDGSSVKPQSTMMRFKFIPITNSALAAPPILLSWDVRAIWYPPHKKFIYAQVKVADNLILNDGCVDESQGAKAIRTAVEAWYNTVVAWPRAIYPPYWESATDTVYGKLQPANPLYQAVINEKSGNIEWVYNMVIMLVDGLTY